MKTDPIRVLVVDDHEIIRRRLRDGLSSAPDLEVVATAPDPYVARDKIVELRPDVLTLDVEMPRMNGVEFLRKLMPQYPLPVIMVSSLTRSGRAITLEALELGAVDYVGKPDGADVTFEAMLEDLKNKIRGAAKIDVGKMLRLRRRLSRIKAGEKKKWTRSPYRIIALGASTGGTVAIRDILTAMSAEYPGIVIVQHMPPGFTRMFADRLNDVCEMEVKEAENGDMIIPGRALIAPADSHMAIKRTGDAARISLFDYDRVSGHRPSVDVMFSSIAENWDAREVVGMILTGMGKDGALGMKELRNRGARTIGQDEKSSIVYGMPKAAYELGAVEYQVPLPRVVSKLDMILNSRPALSSASNGGYK